MRVVPRAFRFAVLFLLPASLAAAPIDYRHWIEGQEFLANEDLFHTRARVYHLGGTSGPGISQYAIKISMQADQEDNGARNAILFDCGMHGREWFASESCYWLVEYLLDRLKDTDPQGTLQAPALRVGVRDLVSNADVWILAQTNPAGRDIDDPAWGDPTEYAYVCKGGSNDGDPCSSDGDCASDDCYRSGWRTNANRSVCASGVDLARNYSSGWNGAHATCLSKFMQYRGPDPFSELETLNMRRFIHNHMISMVGIIHGPSQETWNLWANSSDAISFMVDRLDEINDAGVGPDDEARLPRDSVGNGLGQFSAWLATPSNVVGELDQGTERNISTFYVELQMLNEHGPQLRNGLTIDLGGYETHSYGAQPYQDAPDDGSNTFHPSGKVMEEVWEDSVLPMMLYMIRQARSPQCPVDAFGDRVTGECEAHDYGLVGAKIANAVDQPGLLDYQAGRREETLPAGNRVVVWAVQNFSASAAAGTSVTVTLERDGFVVDTHNEPVNPAAGEREVFIYAHDFEVGEYRVEITLDSDDFSRNNTKVFAFNAVPPTLPPVRAWLLARPKLRFPGVKIPRRPVDPVPPSTPVPGGLVFRAMLPDSSDLPAPDRTGLVMTLRSHHPHVPGVPGKPQGVVRAALPQGSPWWDRSVPERGLWIYADPQGANGPVRQFRIRRTGNDRGKGRGAPSHVLLEAEDLDLRPVIGANGHTIALDLGTEARMTASILGAPPVLPPERLPGEGDVEDEDEPIN